MKFSTKDVNKPRPFTVAEMDAVFDAAVRQQQVRVARAERATDFVTYDPDTQRMLEQAELLSQYDHPVLILGESGTGKEHIARLLHGDRDRVKSGVTTFTITGGFHAINCSGIVDTLFESLLFGHVKGAFTGAHTASPGLLRMAGAGTVFMDEVGDLPLDQQTKLLRVLQTRKVRGVGDSVEKDIDCRFVFATNKPIKEMVRRGEFRLDLYFRIAKFILHTKPLRERECDVIPIANRVAERLGLAKVSSIPKECYTTGNVRGIENYLLWTQIQGMTEEEALRELNT